MRRPYARPGDPVRTRASIHIWITMNITIQGAQRFDHAPSGTMLTSTWIEIAVIG